MGHWARRSLVLVQSAVLAAALLGTPVVRADSPEEAVEEVEEVEAVAAEPTPAPGWLDVVGRFHVAVVHFPIAWIAITLLLDLLAFGLGRRELGQAGLWTLGAGVLSYGPGVLTGLLRQGGISQTEAVQALVETHERLILASLAVAAVALVWRWRNRRALEGGARLLYLALLATACALVFLGAHLGGKVAWGPNHLPF
ncbi:MAG TPA: DUF2231 domain-containing protein [Myxococcota bacterium]|nr:DUF2231 domain-containing protein [Myxococcota bacterium]HQK51439.1 DUF2231 domain-containing protein [Myxococcota bacterium]